MKAIQVLRNVSTTIGDGTTPSNRTTSNRTMERALQRLGEALSFEVVDRCPGPCSFCDEAISHAA